MSAGSVPFIHQFVHYLLSFATVNSKYSLVFCLWACIKYCIWLWGHTVTVPYPYRLFSEATDILRLAGESKCSPDGCPLHPGRWHMPVRAFPFVPHELSQPSAGLNRHHDTSALLGVICKGMLDFRGRQTWTLVWVSLGFWCLKIRLFSFVQWMAYSLTWKHSVGLHFCAPLPFRVGTWEARFHCGISFSSAHTDATLGHLSCIHEQMRWKLLASWMCFLVVGGR